MKKLIALFVIALFMCTISVPVQALPFFKRTKHKTVKKMRKRHIRKAQKGKTFYFRRKGVLVRRR
jgi:cbb3-type cytochrome oxidase cytochrome c subunit